MPAHADTAFGGPEGFGSSLSGVEMPGDTAGTSKAADASEAADAETPADGPDATSDLDAPADTDDSPTPEPETPLQPQLIVINVPDLSWDLLDPEECPHLYHLAEASGLANLSAPWDGLDETIAAEDSIELHLLDASLTLTQKDEIVADILELTDYQQVVAIVSASVFSTEEATHDLTPIIINGEGFSGLIASESTQRVGLVYGEDLIALGNYLASQKGRIEVAYQLNQTDDPLVTLFAVERINPVLTCYSSLASMSERIARLENSTTTIEAINHSKAVVNTFYLLFVVATFGLSALVLLSAYDAKWRRFAYLKPSVQILWIIALSYPPASFLMSLTLPVRPEPLQLMLTCGAWLLVIALAAVAVGLRTRFVNSLLFLFVCSIVVIAIGQLFGGPLHEPGYLTYDITEGSRFYGMGNEQGAVFFGSWFAFSGLLVNSGNPTSRRLAAFRRWGFALVSALLLFIAACPWFGASFGPLAWASFGALSLWWVFNGRSIRWWHVLIALGLSAALAIGTLCADIIMNPLSHMGGYKAAMDKGLLFMLYEVLRSSWHTSSVLIADYIPASAILFLFVALAGLVMVRLVKPGGYREFWERNQVYGAVYMVSMVIALLMFALEDSGFFTPAVFMLFAVSGFIWLVCEIGPLKLAGEADGGGLLAVASG